MKKRIKILLLIVMIDAVGSGSKLTKADAGMGL
jgi:hypothetical protein